MLKTLFSYIWGANATAEELLSIEEAYNIVSPPIEQIPSNVLHIPDESLGTYDLCNKTGKITSVDGSVYKIDGEYQFEGEPGEFLLNATVSYQLLYSDGKLKVTDVNVLETDWNVVETSKRTWCDRVFVCMVKSRTGRLLKVDPGDYSLDLNQISAEFIPIVGDWLEIDAKCVLDENVVDLSGKIIEVNKIRPVRPQIRKGTVNKWDAKTQSGLIDRTIFFAYDSLYCGYVPQPQDRVIAEIIESNQGVCVWRAVKIVPDYIHETGQKKLNAQEFSDCVSSHESVLVTDDIQVAIPKLGQKKIFEIDVENLTEVEMQLVCVELPNLRGQMRLMQSCEREPLKPLKPLNLRFECLAKNIGNNEETVLLHFSTFKLLRKIQIQVGEQNQSRNDVQVQPRRQGPVEIKARRDMIRGVQINQPARFIPVHLPDFAVPDKLFELVVKYDEDRAGLRKDIEQLKPCLVTALNYMNFEDRFHTLLFLDEIHAMLAMRNYDQPRAFFIRNGEYLMLQIDNLAEKRPSIIPNDRVIARNLYKEDTPDFEGFIHKLDKDHVYVKFSHIFHESYNGEDYEITIKASRTSYRREHSGIHLAIRNLGKDWLFPTKVTEKRPQIKLMPENSDQNDSSSSSNSEVSSSETSTSDSSKSRSKKLILQKIQQFKESSQLECRIEWFNTCLNHNQKEAVRNILLGVARPLPYIVFGPPGTGKTVTIVETVLQILCLIPHARILLAAPSNSAADLLALRLVESGVLKPGDLVRLVALSAVASIPLKLAPYCATANIEKEGTETKQPEVMSNGMVMGLSSKVLGRHKITVSTCNTCGVLYMMGFAKGHFTHVIVDEAGQASEPSVLIPLAFIDTTTSQAVMAGDPMQLGPVILSTLASEYGLEESLLERLTTRFPYARDLEGFPETCGYDPRLLTKLVYNYRSLPDLLKLPSMMFYNDDLIPTIDENDSEEAKILEKLKDIVPTTRQGKLAPIVVHGVVGRNYQSEDSPSWFNPQEASQVFYYVNRLYEAGLNSDDIGIIAPYKAQIKEIIELFREATLDAPKIGTVEEFQGQEYNVIIVSTVRSQKSYVDSDIKHSLGFIASPRRLNVSITRAKSLLILVGNPNLLSIDRHWRAVINYCVDRGSLIGCPLLPK